MFLFLQFLSIETVNCTINEFLFVGWFLLLLSRAHECVRACVADRSICAA